MVKKLIDEKYLYWYYRINEKYPPERQTDRMKEAVIFLEEVCFTVFGRDFKENPKKIAALVELKLRVPKENYNINYEDFLGKTGIKNIKIDYSNFIDRQGYPPEPSIEHLGRRYERFIQNPRAEATNDKPLTEAIDSLISMVTPRPVKDKFYEFICSLPDDDHRCPIKCEDLKSKDANLGRESDVSEKVNYFHEDRNTKTWEICFKGKSASYIALVGISYIAYLLGHPGKEVNSTSLVILKQGLPDQDRFSGSMRVQNHLFGDKELMIENQEYKIEVVDEKTIIYLKREIHNYREDIKILKELGDAKEIKTLKDKRKKIKDFLKKNIGKNGKPRKYTIADERARTRVTNAIRLTIEKINNRNPTLALYLKNHIQTGRKCCFIPDSDDSPWSIS